jgi:hypothetical protein
MTNRKHTKLVHEGRYVAEVDIEIMESNDGWAPYLSLDDALKLDDVREALKREDLASVSEKARVYELSRVKVA